jgi:hypothetical protein
MPCYYPLHVARGDVQESGKREILFKKRSDTNASLFPLRLPCGRCIGCKLETSRQWAMRCMNEAQMYDDNCFITLTYSPENVPANGSLRFRDFQLFMKRLRKKVGSLIRFFHCGEYGDKTRRPHYHAIIFNYDFKDKYFWSHTGRGDKLYRSPSLESLWTAGNSLIGDVTFESAAYVARYVVEKLNVSERSDRKAQEAWVRKYVNLETGEIRDAEYTTMSRRPGIGREWYKKYKKDLYNGYDYAIYRGMKVRPPKFYDGLFEIENPVMFRRLKADRVCRATAMDPTGRGESGDRRLAVKEVCKKAQLRALSRHTEV